MGPIPQERWDIDAFYDSDPQKPKKMSTRWAAMLEDVDQFDADFFGLPAEEVEHIDPQQRLFLEVAWEAFEHAGIVPKQLAGTHTGVFAGLCTVDYHRLLYRDFSSIGPYSGTGTTLCIAANRLSYLLDLRGPSMAIDTACSSALATVHLACQSLRSGESDLCIAGGVNLILSPDSTISSSQMRMLSPTGRCHTFDAKADGYVRGEGCGAVILKRLGDARRDGDRILAMIRGSAMNQDGLSNSLTAPNGLAQQAVMKRALENAGVAPRDLSYVEAHAVGTAIGDAIEFKALKTVLMEGRDPRQSCYIGSAKPAIGHLEAASGIAALIKVILSLHHGEIPPHLHLETLNPYISLENTPLAIPTDRQVWPRGDRRRIAGVNAFGFGGTNAHVVVEEAPLAPPLTASASGLRERPHHLLTLSAKGESALADLVQRYLDLLTKTPDVSLPNLCFSANTGRSHFDHRLCVLADSTEALRQQLQSFLADGSVTDGLRGRVRGRKRPKLIFLFPGADRALGLLGRQLYETQSQFRQPFDQCSSLLRPRLDQSLVEQLYQDPLPPSLALGVAIEYSLAQLWQVWGITPAAVAGWGTGEYAAACVAGVLDLETALGLALNQELKQDGLPLSEPDDQLVKATAPRCSLRIPILSSLTGESITEAVAEPGYWRQPPRTVAPGMVRTLSDNNELLMLDGRSIDVLQTEVSAASGDLQGNYGTLLGRLGELYVAGYPVDWSGFDTGYQRQRLLLPTYPFQRQRYWFKPPLPSPTDELPEGSSPILELLKQEEQLPPAQREVLSALLAKFEEQPKAS